MDLKADIVVDLLWGDNGKGKVSHLLLNDKTFFGKNKYTHCLRFNGSGNAGHTIFHKGKKFITHQIPAGVFYGIKSVIGHGCVLRPDKFFEEVKYLESNGIDCSLIKISHATHIVTPEHVSEDNKDVKIGTTKYGNGPAYRDKYNRTGIRAENVDELKPYLIDIYEEFSTGKNTVLCEGAQGFALDIDWGTYYPYVTSSHCTVGSAMLNGIPHKSIRDVFGIIKCYATYVGSYKFQPEGEIFDRIQSVGKEFGATTGRKRQVDWIDLDLVKKSIDINGVDVLVINKMDILREVNAWNVYSGGFVVECKTEKGYKKFIKDVLGKDVDQIIFSDRPDQL